jgi:hypothetical protein
MENNKYEVDVTKMVLNVYNQIANWHNTDFGSNSRKGDALKIVSQSIVQEVLEAMAEGMKIKANMEVKRGDVEISEAKEGTKDFGKSDGKDIFNEIFINKKKE